MDINSIKQVNINNETKRIMGNNARGLKVDLLKALTDIGENEPLEAFIERHGGMDKTIEYLASC